MALLGDDGLGYELARKLESQGVWRSWLGDSNYTNFTHFLLSQSTWESFMNTIDHSKTRAQIHLQLRVRALLFDKATISLYLRPNSSSSSSSKLNPAYLQLHGDDVYFSLEDFGYSLQEGDQQKDASFSNLKNSKIQTKQGYGAAGSKYSEPEADDKSNRSMHDGFPEIWYNQFIEKYRVSKHHKLLLPGDRESYKRTSEGMSTYLKVLERHKRSRQVFKDDQSTGFDNLMHQNSADDEASFFPEMMFPSNCVPDSALPPTNELEDDPKVECYGVLDSLPHVMTRSPAMLERFGIKPEYVRVGLGRSKYRGKNGLEGNGKSLGQEQAIQMSQKVIARILANMGFEGTTEVPIEVLAQFLSCHISKLGRILKVLTDNYRKRYSAIEVLRMFLQTVGYGNLVTLVDHVKDGSRNTPHSTAQQQYLRGIQQGLQPQQHQNVNLQPQQMMRGMNPQMQMGYPQGQTMSFQPQQLDRMRRRPQPSTPRVGDRPMVEVKLENMSESSMDASNFMLQNSRQPQMQQYRMLQQQQQQQQQQQLQQQQQQQLQQQQQQQQQQQLQQQQAYQHKPMSSIQVPHLPTQNTVSVRAQPVKVEGFQDLMGGNSSLKHDSDEHKLTSPSK